jgi:hypothetical protein
VLCAYRRNLPAPLQVTSVLASQPFSFDHPNGGTELLPAKTKVRVTYGVEKEQNVASNPAFDFSRTVNHCALPRTDTCTR